MTQRNGTQRYATSTLNTVWYDRRTQFGAVYPAIDLCHGDRRYVLSR
jgi:hypothetical protein